MRKISQGLKAAAFMMAAFLVVSGGCGTKKAVDAPNPDAGGGAGGDVGNGAGGTPGTDGGEGGAGPSGGRGAGGSSLGGSGGVAANNDSGADACSIDNLPRGAVAAVGERCPTNESGPGPCVPGTYCYTTSVCSCGVPEPTTQFLCDCSGHRILIANFDPSDCFNPCPTGGRAGG